MVDVQSCRKHAATYWYIDILRWWQENIFKNLLVLFDGRCQKLIDIIILLEEIEYPVNAKKLLGIFR